MRLGVSHAALLVVTLGALPARAQAPSPNEAAAQALFEQGRAAADAKDCKKAIGLFEQSLALFRSRGALFNLGRCEIALKRYGNAWSHLHDLLPTLDPGDDRLAETKAMIADAEKHIGLLTVTLDGSPAGAHARVDRVPVSVDPPAPVPVEAGREVTISATAQGRMPVERKVTLKAGEKRSVPILLPLAPPEAPMKASAPAPGAVAAPAPGAVAAPAPGAGVAPAGPTSGAGETPSPETDGAGARTVGWVIGGIGIASLGVAAVTGGLAINRKGVLEDECPTPSPCTSRASDLANEGETFATASTATFVGGAVALVAGTALVLLNGSKVVTAETSSKGAAIAVRF